MCTLVEMNPVPLWTQLEFDWYVLTLILLGWWVLQSLSSEERQQILLRVAEALVVNEERINAENEADVEAAQLNGIAKSLVGRLTIKPGKVSHKSGYRSPLSKGLRSCHPLPAIWTYVHAYQTQFELHQLRTLFRLWVVGTFAFKVLMVFLISQIASFANSLRVLSEMKDPIGAVTKRTEVGFCLACWLLGQGVRQQTFILLMWNVECRMYYSLMMAGCRMYVVSIWITRHQGKEAKN